MVICLRVVYFYQLRISHLIFNEGFTHGFQLWLPQGPSVFVTNGNGKQMAVNLKVWRRKRAECHQAMIYETLQNKKCTSWLRRQISYFLETWSRETLLVEIHLYPFQANWRYMPLPIFPENSNNKRKYESLQFPIEINSKGSTTFFLFHKSNYLQGQSFDSLQNNMLHNIWFARNVATSMYF